MRLRQSSHFCVASPLTAKLRRRVEYVLAMIESDGHKGGISEWIEDGDARRFARNFALTLIKSVIQASSVSTCPNIGGACVARRSRKVFMFLAVRVRSRKSPVLDTYSIH